MCELIQQGDLAVRLMRDDIGDCQLMSKWLSDPRVLEFYEGRDNPFPLDRIREKYAHRVLSSEGVTACFLVYRGIPAGYLQYYPLTEETKMTFGLESESDVTDVYGIDQFIGEADLWNRGIGTRAVDLFLAYLFETHGARKVVVDPHVDNARAIRCYEKCGFRKVKTLPRHELHEGEYRDSWLMEVTPSTRNT